MSALGLLGVCFVVMKILGLIDWSWSLEKGNGIALRSIDEICNFAERTKKRKDDERTDENR